MSYFVPGGPTRYEHQRRGLKKLIETRGIGALLFDPGTGKTATALDYACLLALKSPTGEARILVTAPLAAVDTWVLQAAIWMSPQVNYWAEALGGTVEQRAQALASRGGRPFSHTYPPKRGRCDRRALHHAKALAQESRPRVEPSEGPDALGDTRPRVVIEIVNLDTFSSRRTFRSGTIADHLLDSIKRYDPDIVIVDESHKIKTPSSNVSRLLSRIGQVVPRRMILTGTVMPHSPLDVFGQWRFLDPTAFGPPLPGGLRRRATFASFRYRFANLGGYMGHEVVSFRNLDQMQDIMAERAEVARKEDALDLPPTSDVIVPVNLNAAETRAYDELLGDLTTRLDTGDLATTSNRLAQMMRLRQITAGHLPSDDGVVHDLGSSKAKTIASIVHDTLAGEKRVVIFTVFKAEIVAVQRALVAKGTEVMTIDGSTPHARRQEIRRRFGSGDPARIVLVAQVKTLSLAVNELVTASHAIFASLSQQRDDLIQARDRLNRIGQTRPVTFWYCLAPKSVDEVIYSSHTDRTSLEAAMLKHIRARGQED